jgi:hypothetical protein
MKEDMDNRKPYFAGQLDFTTNPLDINVFMQLHPLYQSCGELPKCPGFPFPFSGLNIHCSKVANISLAISLFRHRTKIKTMSNIHNWCSR